MIYTITLVSDLIGRTNAGGHRYYRRDFRNAGYFSDKEIAIEAICENRNDLHRACYIYAVIEAFPEGVDPLSDIDDEQWFAWCEESSTFKPDLKPDDLRHLDGFFMS